MIGHARVLAAGLVPVFALGANTPEVRLEPPSSLEPGRERALVTFEHEERRARRCFEDRSWCGADHRRLPTAGTLRVELVPIVQPRLGRKDERQTEVVTIAGGRAPARAEVVIAAGEWSLRVPRARSRRLGVRDGEKTSIRIWTLKGWCWREEQRCLFQPDAVLRLVRAMPQPDARW